MKTKILFVWLLLGGTHLMAQSAPAAKPVTTSDYCEFLNERAASGAPQTAQEIENGNWKMGADVLEAAAILRSGAPGSWRYEVIPEKEKMPMTFLSYNDAVAYCVWKNSATSTFNFNCCVSSYDPDLKSNILPFYITSSGSASHQASGAAAVVGTELDAILEEAVGVIALGAAGAEGARASEIEDVGPNEEMTTQRAEEISLLHLRTDNSSDYSADFPIKFQENLISQKLEQLFSQKNPFLADYADADDLWKQRERAWQSHGTAYHELKEKSDNLERATEQEEQAREADRNRDENQLGKIKTRLEKFAGVLRYVPEPASQTIAAGVETVTSALDWINKAWTRVTLVQAMLAKHTALQACAEAERQADQANGISINLEKKAHQKENELLAQEQAFIVKRAQELHSELTWGESEWQRWSENFFSGDASENSQKEIFAFADEGRRHQTFIQEVTGGFWQKHLKALQQEWQTMKTEGHSLLSSLKVVYHREERILQKKENAIQRAATLLESACARQAELKERVEKFLEECQQGNGFNQRKINRSRQTFVESFEELIKTTLDVERFAQEKEQAITAYQAQGRKALEASQQLESEREKFKRFQSRAESRFQAYRAELGKKWPKHEVTYRPLLGWELPFSTAHESNTEKPTANFFDEPPLLQQELEARGRRFIYDMYVMPKASLKVASETIQTSSDLSEKTIFSVHNSQMLSPKNEPISIPINEERLQLRRQLNLLHKETDRLALILQNEKEVEQRGGQSLFSARTLKKAPSRLSAFTLRSRTSTSTVESKPTDVAALEKEFQEAFKKENEARERWVVMISEPAMIDFYATADDQALENEDRRTALEQEKKDAAAMEEDWATNTKRWQLRAAAEDAVKALNELQEEQQNLVKNKTLSETQRLQRARELESQITSATAKVAQTEQAWEEEAKKFSTTPLPKLKKFDQRVLTRWDQFQENQLHAGAHDPESVADQKREIYIYTLGERLQEFETKAFTLSHEIPTIVQAAEKYLGMALKEALRAAEENIPGAAKAWSERVAKGKNKLEDQEKKLNDPQISRKEKSEIRDTLPQLKGVVSADQKASMAFEKEQKRLARIETIWKGIEEAKAEAAYKKAHAAAIALHEGFRTAWEGLLGAEQEKYIAHINQKNGEYLVALGTEEAFLEQVRNQLDHEQRRANQFLSRLAGALTGNQEVALQLLHDAQKYYERRYADLLQRKKAIRWGSMTAEERAIDAANEERERWAPFLEIKANINAPAEEAWAAAKEAYNNVELWKRSEQLANAACDSWKRVIAERGGGTQSLRMWNTTNTIPLSEEEKNEALFQKSRWEGKGALVAMRVAIAQGRTPGWVWKDYGYVWDRYDNYYEDRFVKIAHKKALPLLLSSMENFKKYPNVESLEAVRRAASTHISTILLLSSSRGWRLFNEAFLVASASTSTASDCIFAATFAQIEAGTLRDQESNFLRISEEVCVHVSALIQNAADIATAAEAAEDAEALTQVHNLVVDYRLQYEKARTYYSWTDLGTFLKITEKGAEFARAVAAFKKAKEESAKTPPVWHELEVPALMAFAHAAELRTPAAWKEASQAAQQTVENWKNFIAEQKRGVAAFSCSLEEAKDQWDRWEQKKILAKIKVLKPDPDLVIWSRDLEECISIEGKIFFRNKKPLERSLAAAENERTTQIEHLLREECWPALARSMKRFIEHPHEMESIRNLNATEAADAADNIELLAEDRKREPMLYRYNKKKIKSESIQNLQDKRTQKFIQNKRTSTLGLDKLFNKVREREQKEKENELEALQKTIAFLRAVAELKKAQSFSK